MTGPEHYLEAERRLLMSWEDDSTPERSAGLVAEAQVHATLALAAATASQQVDVAMDDDVARLVVERDQYRTEVSILDRGIKATETWTSGLARVREAIRNGEARRVRVAARLSCSEVAKACGVDQSTVWRWEKGIREPRGDEAIAYLALLDSLLNPTGEASR